MENLGTIGMWLGMVATVLIAGVAWGDIRRQVHTLAEQWDRDREARERDREETRDWLKGLQEKYVEQHGHIEVLLDRIER